MKAIVQERYGDPREVLRLGDVDEPEPADDEVLVRVEAASVNAANWHVVRGDPYLARAGLGLRRPRHRVPGRDVSGVVERVGPAVTTLRPGDPVLAELDAFGAFAELATAPARHVRPRPPGLSPVAAACLPLAGVTALTALREVGAVQPGQRVLVLGASGGVGHLAVQVAAALGADVTAVCSPRNVEQALELGATRVVDYTREQAGARGPHDVVLDLAGTRSLGDLLALATPDGTVLLTGGGVYDGGSLLGPMRLLLRGTLPSRRRQSVRTVMAKVDGDLLADLVGMVEAGTVRPVVERTWPLHDVPAAVAHLEREHARAKMAVTIPA